MNTLVATAAALVLLCGACPGQAASVAVDLRTPEGDPVQDAVVWLEPATPVAAATRPAAVVHAEIQQLKLEFVPFVSVVPVGTRIDFPNRDKVKHHVYSFSPAKNFEIQLYSGTPVAPVLFDKAGPVVLGCNIHDWMEAYVMVVDSPWFAKSDASGRSVVDGAPAGHYRLHSWHPYQKAAVAVQDLELAAGPARLPLRVVIDLAVPPRKPRRPLDEHY